MLFYPARPLAMSRNIIVDSKIFFMTYGTTVLITSDATPLFH